MRINRLVLVSLALVLFGACGGDGARPQAEGPSPTTTSFGSSSPAPDGRSTDPATPASGAKGSAKPKSSVSPNPAGTEASASLDKPCVRRGNFDDRQGLVIRTKPRWPYGYATEYSDGSSIVTPGKEKEYEPDGEGPIGGQGGGMADANGNAHPTWVVPPTAPLGEATVTVNLGTPTPPQFKFVVVDTSGTCP